MSQESSTVKFAQPEAAAPAEQPAAQAAPAPQAAESVSVAMPQQAPETNGHTGSPTPAEPTNRVHQAPAQQNTTGLALGRGLDVGTANLLSSCEDEDGDIAVMRERNAFLEIPAEFVGNREMLTKLNVPYVQYKDRLFVLGDASFDLANMFGQEIRRPMQDGFLSPGEHDAIPMMRFIMHRLLGDPRVPGESVCFCIPAASIDKDNDTVYHEGIVSGILTKLGYTPRSMNEAHAVVYSALGDQDFTGIGVSCGAGMFNVCVAYKTIPALMFSVSRGGDWIDQHVARVMGIPRTRAAAIKEGDVNLMAPRSREEEAVVLYYRSLIQYVLQNLKQRFQLARDVPQFDKPVEVVVAGGTSLVGGFVEVFAQELQKVKFPIPISGVRRADDAITSVARGCLIAANLDS
jgi:hypothetical protein